MDGLSGGGQEITTTQTNPKVPKEFEGVANMLRLLASGMLSSPMNFGPTGLDAPASGPLVPQPSMGNLFTSSPYQMGANRMRIAGGSRMGNMGKGGNWGEFFKGGGGDLSGGGTIGTSKNSGMGKYGNWGDLFTKPYVDDQKRLANFV